MAVGYINIMRSSSVSALALLAFSSTGYAQTNAGAVAPQQTAENNVSDIVVTAQFRAQNLQDTPIAITAMNAEMMEARSQTGLTDIAQSAPNVTIRQSVSAYGNTAALSIRGVGQFDNNFAYEPGVGLYVDDVYYPTVYGAQLDLLDLDRAEILRGPQGTLAGKNSIGGAVKLYSRRPRGTGEGFIEATVGNFDRLDFRGSVDIPIVDDKVALRLAGVYKGRKGHVDRMDFGCLNPSSGVPRLPESGSSCRLGRLGGQDFQGLRGSLSIRPNDRLEVLLIADWTRDNSEAAGTRISAVNNGALGPVAAGITMDKFLQGGRYVSYGSFADPSRNLTVSDRNGYKGWGVSGQIEYELSDTLKLTSITAYRKYSANYGLDLDGTPYGLATQAFGLGFRSFSQEVRLTGTALDDMVNYTVGGFYFDAKGRYDSIIDFLSPANNFYIGADTIPSDSKSGFAHVELHPAENFTLSGGLRYTDESKDFTFGRVSLLTLPFTLGDLNGQTFKYSASRWDYRLSADYRWSRNVMTYATFSTGFKGGGINPRPFFVEQVVPFYPETLKAFEVGTKLDFLDRRVRLNLSAFLNKYDDIQLILNQRFRGTAPASVPINAGKAEMKGFEAELTLTPVDGLLIDASVSHLDFDYKTLSSEAVASGIGIGMVAPFTSDWKLSGGIQYEIDAGSTGSFIPRFDYAYQSKFWSNAANRPTNETPGYGIANARLTWRHPDKKLDVSLAVTNLFDKYYDTVNYDNLYSIAGVAQGTLGRPREWAVTAKYNF
ncbi:MAG: TonB-dependent receptor [Sphingobium sp.]|nr:TonB-dependent receptor [Sphingobium sp.]